MYSACIQQIGARLYQVVKLVEQQCLVGVARSGQGGLPRPRRAEHLFGTARPHQGSGNFSDVLRKAVMQSFFDSVLTRYMGPPCWIPCSPGCAVDRLQLLVGLQETPLVAPLKSKHAAIPRSSGDVQ